MIVEAGNRQTEKHEKHSFIKPHLKADKLRIKETYQDQLLQVFHI